MAKLPTGSEFDTLVKKRTIIAIALYDELRTRLVLKGGNALDLAYHIAPRASLDLDFSIRGDVSHPDELRTPLVRGLTESFDEVGLVPFDVKISFRPPQISSDVIDFWGGYLVEFKLIERATAAKYAGDDELLRRNAKPIGPSRSTKYSLDLSLHEYCDSCQSIRIDEYEVLVYTPQLIVCEKLRAICQQLPEYGAIVNRSHQRRGRTNDFVDICAVIDHFPFDASAVGIRTLLENVFSAKKVPLEFLELVPQTRELHAADFPRVQQTWQGGKLQPFDYYFERVVSLCRELRALGDV